MHWPFAYSPNIWPLAFAVVFLLLLSWVGWRNRRVPGALPFALAMLFLALWGGGTALKVAATDLSTMVDCLRFATLWSLPSATAMLCFALQFAGLGRWLTRRTLALFSLPVLLADGLILTNDIHHLVWQGFSYAGYLRPVRGALTPVLVAYGYLLATVTIAVLVWLFIRSPRHRWPVALALCGQLVFRVAYTIDFAGANPLAPLDLTILGALVAATLYAIALLRFRVFDPIPLARVAVIEQMREGMMVLDERGAIVDLNAAAQGILGISAAQARGRDAASLLPGWAAARDGPEAGAPEVTLTSGSAARRYLLHLSALKDAYGAVGHLILLHDVTEQALAQERLVEQQRVMAALQEREHLARELHDSLGQVLGYVSLQAQAIRRRVQAWDAAAAEAQLARLADVAQAAHQDLRDSILNLRAGAREGWTFPAALRQYLESYQAQYGVRATVALAGPPAEDDLAPDTGVQVLRVIQETLTNAHRHRHAHAVEVSLARTGDQVRIVVADDGCGFDPAQVAENEGRHLGLANMRSRMAQVGGSVTIDSRPGAGTRVVLQVPVADRGRNGE